MNNFAKRVITSLILIFVIYLSLVNSIFLFFILFAISFFALIEFNYIFKKIYEKEQFKRFLFIFFSLIYLTIFSISIWIHLQSFNNIKVLSLIFLLLICISTDVGGYIFGKIIGGKRLTKISPNKTYSGVFGSFFLAIIFGLLFTYFQKKIPNFDINIVILIILVSLISQLGDLIISFLKRKAKIKDTGSVLPGHGGVLDRIDGIIFAIPAGILLISI